MSGYYGEDGFYGLVNGRYMLFASDSDYYDMGEPERVERMEYQDDYFDDEVYEIAA